MRTACVNCRNEKFKETFGDLSRHVAGREFKAMLPSRKCTSCGVKYYASEDLARFDLMVAITLAHAAVNEPEALKFMRKVTGLQAKQFADLLGVRPETVSRWESGRAGIDRATYALLQQFLLDRLEGSSATQRRLRIMMHPKKLPKIIPAEDVTLAGIIDRFSDPDGLRYIAGVDAYLIERLLERKFLKLHPRQVYEVTNPGREFKNRVLGQRAA